MPQVNVGPVVPSHVEPSDAGSPIPFQDTEQPMLSSVFNAPPSPQAQQAPANEAPQGPTNASPEDSGTQGTPQSQSLGAQIPSMAPQRVPQTQDDEAVSDIQDQLLKNAGDHAISDDIFSDNDKAAIKDELSNLGKKSSSLWDPERSTKDNLTNLLDRGQSGLGRNDLQKLAPYIQHYGKNNVKLQDGVISVKQNGQWQVMAGDSNVNPLTGEGDLSGISKLLLDHSGDELAVGANVASMIAGSAAASSLAPKFLGAASQSAQEAAAIGEVASQSASSSALISVLAGGIGDGVRSGAMKVLDVLRGTHQDPGIAEDMKTAFGQGAANLFMHYGYAGISKGMEVASSVFKGMSAMPTIRALGAVKARFQDYLSEMGFEHLGLETTGGALKTASDETHARLGAAVEAVNSEAKRLIGQNRIQMPTVQGKIAMIVKFHDGEIDPISGLAKLPEAPNKPVTGVPLSTEMSDAAMSNAGVRANQVADNARRAEQTAATFKASSAFGGVQGGQNKLQKLVDFHNQLISSNAARGGIDFDAMQMGIKDLGEWGNLGSDKFGNQVKASDAFEQAARMLRHSAAEDRANLFDSTFRNQNSNQADIWKQAYKEFADNKGSIDVINNAFNGKGAAVAAKSLIRPDNPTGIRAVKAVAPEAWPTLRAEWLNQLVSDSTTASGVVNGQVVKDTLKGYGPDVLKEMFSDTPDMQAKLYGIAEDAMRIRASKVFNPEQLMVNPSDITRMAFGAGTGHPFMAVTPVARVFSQVYNNKNAMDWLLKDEFINQCRLGYTSEQKSVIANIMMNMKKAMKSSRVIDVNGVQMYVPSITRSAVSAAGAVGARGFFSGEDNQ